MKKSFLFLILVLFFTFNFQLSTCNHLFAETAPTLVWQRMYNSGNNDYGCGIAVDDTGNVYVTGQSYNGANGDYLTIKYNSNGDTVWQKVYNSGSEDCGYGIAVDSSSNVYVTGKSNISYLNIKYNSSGDTVWQKVHDDVSNVRWGNGIAVDSSGNVYITGRDPYGALTMKCNSNGDTIWQKAYGSGLGEEGHNIVVDDTGNICVIEYFYNGANRDYLTIKYDTNGNTVWQKVYNGGNNDYGYGIAVDASGNVYVTGSSFNGSNYDYFTIKYNSNGDTVWQKIYDSGLGDEGHGITVDSSGNVYVTGSSFNGSDSDYLTIKYSSSGDTVWQKVYNGGYEDFGHGIAVDASGNVYVTGWSYNGANYDYLTIKYTQNPSPATKLKITTIPFTIPNYTTSPPIMVEAQDNTGTKDTSFNGTVTLASSSPSGKFSISASSWVDITFIDLFAGYCSFYYSDTQTGNPTITVSRAGLISDAQVETITTGGPPPVSDTQSYIILNPASVPANGSSACSATVYIRDSMGAPINAKEVTLQSSRGTFYDTISPPSLSSDPNGACTFTIRSSFAGTTTITALCDSKVISCTPPGTFLIFTATKLKIVTPPRTVRAGVSSDSIAVQAQDGAGNKDTGFNNTVTLLTSSNTGSFSISNTAWIPVSVITLANGEGTFYYKDSVTGSPVITVSRTGLKSDTQTQSILYGAITLKIITPLRTVQSGSASESIAVQAQTNTGALDVTYNGTVTYASSSATGKFGANLTDWSPANTFFAKAVSGETWVYYKDITVGTWVITVSAVNLQSDNQGIIVTSVSSVVSETQSFILLKPTSVPANGFSPCTVTIYVKNSTGNPLSGKLVTVQTNRGPSYDTITQPSATDVNGMCTGTIVSSYAGADTPVWATCEGKTISCSPPGTVLYFTAAKLKITSLSFTIPNYSTSPSITVEAQDNAGVKDTNFNGTVTLQSSSLSGKFSLSQSPWIDTNIIMLSNGQKTFYYSDTQTGNPTITVSRAGFISDAQVETITTGGPPPVSDTQSYIILNPASVPANGSSACSATVYIRDSMGAPINAKEVTLQSTRGNSDTINDSVGGTVNPQTTDANGQCTFTVKSNYAGQDSVTATCEGKAISCSPVVTLTFTASRLRFITSPSTIYVGPATGKVIGSIISFEAVDGVGSRDTSFNGTATLSSSSAGGRFSKDNVNWNSASDSDMTFVNGLAQFYYKNTVDSSPVVTVSHAPWSSDSQTQNIVIDSTPPSGSVSINNNAEYGNSNAVTLSLSAVDTQVSVDTVVISNAIAFTSASTYTYSTSKSWSLDNAEGVRTVYVKFIDMLGNTSGAYSDTIFLDFTPPATGTILIKTDTASIYAYSQQVLLQLSVAADTLTSVDTMILSNVSSFSTCETRAYSDTTLWNLSSGDGSKTVYVRFMDRARNVTTVYNDTIIQIMGTIKGTVYETSPTDTSYQNITGIIIDAMKDTQVIATTTTWTDGSFEFTNLESGTYSIRATWSANDIISSVASDIRTATLGVTYTLSVYYRLAIITGSVADVKPKFTQFKFGCRVLSVESDGFVELSQRGRVLVSVPTDAGGNYLIPNLLPGTYQARAFNGYIWSKTLTVRLQEGENLVLNFTFESLPEEKAFNYPNPVISGSTKIKFYCSFANPEFEIRIYNIAGELVKTIRHSEISGTKPQYEYNWSCTNDYSEPVASGVYLYLIIATEKSTGERRTVTKKLIIIR